MRAIVMLLAALAIVGCDSPVANVEPERDPPTTPFDGLLDEYVARVMACLEAHQATGATVDQATLDRCVSEAGEQA